MQRTVVITGGASGIGLAIAECFAELGDRVFNLDISEGSVGEPVTVLDYITKPINRVSSRALTEK